jgi:SWI/SNF-related matrix-associated actin-dependent regulator 1 of chromatin subfamily A
MIDNAFQIIQAAVAIQLRCDGAVEKDGVGFAGSDVAPMSNYLSKPSLSDADIEDMSNRLQKYDKQLTNYGFDVKTLVPVRNGTGRNERGVILYNGKPIKIQESWKQVKMDFGKKHKDRTVYEVIAMGDIGYFEWAAKEVDNERMRKIANAVLRSEPIAIEDVKKDNTVFVTMGSKGDTIAIKGSYEVQFPVKEIIEDVGCRKIFDGNSKSWILPATAIEQVMIKFPNPSFPDIQYDAATLEYAEKYKKNLEEMKEKAKVGDTTVNEISKGNYDIDGFGDGRRKLYEFQHTALKFMAKTNGRAIIGDDMGLGKTTEALAFAYLHKDNGKILVVCPASLKYNWEREFKICFGDKYKCKVLEGTKPYEIPKDVNIVVINYNVTHQWMDYLKKFGFLLIIIDEAHILRNYKSPNYYTKEYGADVPKMAIGTYEIALTCKYRLLLTGTPMVNRPRDLYPLLSLVNPELYPNNGLGFQKFGMQYCDPQEIIIQGGKKITTYDGATNLEDLHEELKPMMIRRLKSEVLKDLPDKTRVSLDVSITNDSEYHKAEKEFLDWLEEYRVTHPKYDAEGAPVPLSDIEIAKINSLKQVAARGKVRPASEWIENFLETGNKLVIFAWHSQLINELYEIFSSKAVVLDGEMNSKQKDDATQAFQNNDNVRLIICNIRSGGVGHTMTAASNVLFLEFAWTPSDHDQAEDRVLRIGQKYPVTCYYMAAKGTVDERIIGMLEYKRENITMVIDGKSEINNLTYDLFPEVSGTQRVKVVKVKAKEVELNEKQIKVLEEAMFAVMKKEQELSQVALIEILKGGIKDFDIKDENVRYVVSKWDGYIVKTGRREGRSIILKYIKSP